MFFHKSRDYKRPPIELAYMLLHGAMSLAYSYLRNKKLKVSADDLRNIDMFVEELHKSHATAQYISTCLHQRNRGEEECSEKFANKESFDWHCPP